MKKFAVKLRCCNNAVIQMLFDILGAIKVKNIFGYELLLATYLRISISLILQFSPYHKYIFCGARCFLLGCFFASLAVAVTIITIMFFFADCYGVLWGWKCC